MRKDNPVADLALFELLDGGVSFCYHDCLFFRKHAKIKFLHDQFPLVIRLLLPDKG
jgi:hypothetical protein